MINPKISAAIAAILGGVSVGARAAEPVAAADANGGGLEEIVVTAQRRSESMQNVPIAMQAFTSQTLSQLNVSTLDDYIKFLPNVTTANNGPGQNEVFMRGLSAGSQASQGSGATGLSPNVAIYLDNQSGQLPNRNLDIYAADLNRIEVLEGPQGTLFGSGAEAGVIRYITNEPKLNVLEGSVKAGAGVTAHGDPNADVTAVLNVPLIDDVLAVRGVIYDDHRGGYIDNVPGTFTRSNTDIGIHYANYATACAIGAPDTFGTCAVVNDSAGKNRNSVTAFDVPPGSPTLNNNRLTGKGINPVTYQGLRVEGLYKINADWDVLISQLWQSMDSSGVFYQQPNSSDGVRLNPLEVTLFNKAFDKDRFSNTAVTVNGKFGALKAVYTGGYLVRNVEQTGDYTNYSRGVYADYYQCFGAGSGGPNNPNATCYSPSATWFTAERNVHAQHEFRLSTPDDWRFRAIGGAYYEDNKLYEQTSWKYRTVPDCTSSGTAGTDPGNSGCFSVVGTFPGTTVKYPGLHGDRTSFYQDETRETKQLAFFASFDFDIIPKVLTATLGARHFRFDYSFKGSVLSSFGCFAQGVPATGCHNPAFSYNLDAQNLSGRESGTKGRANITWHVTPAAMVYYTYSQGFRPGGFNQNGGSLHANGTDVDSTGAAIKQIALPAAYQSDQLTNNEIGWKTEFLDHRLQWNGAIYRENWNNVQISFFDSGLLGNLFFDTNGQNFVIKGLETSVVAKVLAGLTVQGAASWNQSRQTNSPNLIDNNPLSANFGHAITQACDGTGANCVAVTNPFGLVGSPSANAPPLQYSLRARYEWAASEFHPYVQVGATHTGNSYTQAGSNPTFAQGGGAIGTSRLRFLNPAYSTVEASIGIARDAWHLDLFGENLTNSNASTFTSTDQFIVAQTPLRPRILGLSASYKF